MKTKVFFFFFEKTNKLDKVLARLVQKKREKTQINKIRNEGGEITISQRYNNNNKRILRQESEHPWRN